MQGTGHDGLKVAIKVLDRSVTKKKGGWNREASQTTAEQREIAIMKKLTHPHCVQLFEVIDDSANDRTFLIME